MRILNILYLDIGFGFVLLKIFGEHIGIIVYLPVTATPYDIDTHTKKTAS